MHLATGRDDDNDLQTISSGNYVPLADDSENDDTTERLFHWDGRREVQRERRVAAWEYARFHCWVVEHLDGRGKGLVDTFCASLAPEYTAGQYTSPPVGQI